MRPATRTASSLALVLVVAACSTSTTRGFETTVAKTLVTPEQENQIGLQLKTELDQKQQVVYLNDPETVGYVRAIAAKIIALGMRDRPEVQWQVFVIDDRKNVNAFAAPGGYLYVYRGLLETAGSDAELAGVMAHETGHVVARHAARNLIAAYGLDGIAALATGKNPGLLEQLGAGIATKGLLLSHSRADETEADEYGVRYAAGAGYDPHAFVTLFQKLQQKEGATPGVMTYLSNHPATQDRIDHLNGYIAAQNLTGATVGADTYERMRTRLARLPSGTPAGAPPAPPGAPPAPPAGAPPPA